MKVPFVTFLPMEKELDGELRAAFDRVLTSSWYIGGKEDKAFEEAFAGYCGADYCVGVGNGLDALMLSLKALDIGAGDEVLYRINDSIIQGIYTGTHPDYMNCSGMNLLTWHTIQYYGSKGYKILDKAISTEDSEPNYGLCNFKESVGCERSLKYTFRKELKKG